MTAIPLAGVVKRIGKVGVLLLVLNEIRGVFVVASIVWAWVKTTT
jgi:hypothetical protein